MSATRFLSCIALGLVACGGPQVHDDEGRIPRARTEAEVWASALADCAPAIGGETRVEGTLARTAGGVTTRLFCMAPGCCNSVTPYGFEIVSGGTSKTIDVSAAGHAPDVFLREGGTVLDCEWDAWRDVLDATPVTVVGVLDGEILHVSEICRPDVAP